MPDPSPLLQAVEAFRAALLRNDAQALGRLIDAYKRAYSRLGGSIDALMLQIGDKPMTTGQVMRMERYKSLMQQVGEELMGFQAMSINEAERAAQLGIQLGQNHARQLMAYTVGRPEIAAQFNVLPKGAIETVLAFLQPEGQLYKRLRLIAPHTASLVADAITSGVALGYNPRKTAAIIQDAFGQGLTDALRQVRTVQLWSYRESARATYLVNSDVVESWLWSAHIGDSRTCMACVSQHGTEHLLSETLNGHYNCRCAMVPVVKGFDRAITETGEEWFNKQNEVTQSAMMGKSKHAAWKEGRFEFSQLATEHNDPVYGMMKTEQSLKALLGE